MFPGYRFFSSIDLDARICTPVLITFSAKTAPHVTGAAALIQDVEEALNSEDVRPLTDTVSVYQATDVTYTLNVKYLCDNSSATTQAVEDAVTEYQKWQDSTIGLAFNPDRLMAALYQAGCTRVIWDTGSAFDGGNVEYTQIEANERCKGTITLTAMSA